jgi:hypothetical protein
MVEMCQDEKSCVTWQKRFNEGMVETCQDEKSCDVAEGIWWRRVRQFQIMKERMAYHYQYERIFEDTGLVPHPLLAVEPWRSGRGWGEKSC